MFDNLHINLCRINNAGSNAYKYKPLAESTDADLIRIVETNVLGVMLGCKEVRITPAPLPHPTSVGSIQSFSRLSSEVWQGSACRKNGHQPRDAVGLACDLHSL